MIGYSQLMKISKSKPHILIITIMMVVVVSLIAGSTRAADEFPPLPLRPKIPENVLPQNQKFPPKRKKTVRMKLPPEMTRGDIYNLIVPQLSNACVHNRFNQVRKGLNYVTLQRPDGAGVYRFDAASTGDGNLRDSDAIGLPTMLYLFERDATSECRVFSIPYFNN